MSSVSPVCFRLSPVPTISDKRRNGEKGEKGRHNHNPTQPNQREPPHRAHAPAPLPPHTRLAATHHPTHPPPPRAWLQPIAAVLRLSERVQRMEIALPFSPLPIHPSPPSPSTPSPPLPLASSPAAGGTPVARLSRTLRSHQQTRCVAPRACVCARVLPLSSRPPPPNHSRWQTARQ